MPRIQNISIINSTQREQGSQYGFLLIEALVALTSLLVLGLIWATAYGTLMARERELVVRLQRVGSASNYLHMLRTRHEEPRVGIITYEDVAMRVTAVPLKSIMRGWVVRVNDLTTVVLA